MSNSTAWVSSDTQENLNFIHTILDMAFKAAGIATFAIGAYNYGEVVRAITRVARGHARTEDLRLAEAGVRQGGTAAERAIQAAAAGLARLNHVGEAQRLQEVLEKANQMPAVKT